VEVMTDVASLRQPDLFKSLFFQEASRGCIFSIIKRKSLLLALQLRIGKPRYLSRKAVLLLLVIDVSLLILDWGVPAE
jgi:hypothetical protein